MRTNDKATRPPISKLHLGCGKRSIPGFIHVDIVHYPHVDYKCDVADLGMFQSNTVGLIYACHVLEHFKRDNVEQVLREWHRVLTPGGVLRIAVPDFEAIVKIYQRSKELELIMGLLYGRQDDGHNFHHVAFDFTYLKQLLEKVGFTQIERYDWRNTIHKSYDDFSQAYIPHMDKEHGMLVSLNVEAKKR